ncbi:hypothetical protein [Streptomyces sp. NRRL S-350]|uniref:hypothetical protein n=1 Tax=Streptomyces sp. NRRL S-350 TaxID=1463902 RepID=UPI00068ABD69|nr:hypothetical protein [Streptomyces sp. NRRL S-350]
MAESRFSDTIAHLEAELPGIEARRRRLEDDLTAAVARENAVRAAIESLRALAGLQASQDITPVGSIRAEADAIVGVRPQQIAAETQAGPDQGGDPAKKATTRTDPATKTAKKTAAKKTTAKKTTAKKTTVKKAAPAKKTAAKKATAEKSAAKKAAATKTVDGARPRTPAKKTVAARGTGPVRTSVNMNAVRTMLERLAKAGRVQRPGRGLYAKLNG